MNSDFPYFISLPLIFATIYAAVWSIKYCLRRLPSQLSTRNLSKTSELAKPNAQKDTKARPPRGIQNRPKLNEETNRSLASQPSDSRCRDISNLDAKAEPESCKIEHPTTEKAETTEQNTSSKESEEHLTSVSSETEHIAEEQATAVERRITGATPSGTVVETPKSPDSSTNHPSQFPASPVPANKPREQPQTVESRVQSTTRPVIVTESDNDTVTSEDAHPTPPDSPISCYKTKPSRRRQRKNKIAQPPKSAESPKSPTLPGNGIRLQQPSPRQSPNANTNVYRPSGVPVSPPPGYPRLQLHPEMDYRAAPRPPPAPGIVLQTHATSETSAATRTNAQPSHSVPPSPRVTAKMLPPSDNGNATIVPRISAFQPDVATQYAPRKFYSSPWSPFASGVNIELGSQIRNNNTRDHDRFYQRSSSTGVVSHNDPAKRNFIESLRSPQPIIEEQHVDRRYGQGSSASFFSNPNPSFRPNPNSSSPSVPQSVGAFSRMPPSQVPNNGRRIAEPYSNRNFSLFDKRLAFSSTEEC